MEVSVFLYVFAYVYEEKEDEEGRARSDKVINMSPVYVKRLYA